MMLHSLREPFDGTALATVVSMLAIPLAVICADVVRADKPSDSDRAVVRLPSDEPAARARRSNSCCTCGEPDDELDRFWLINTRHMSSQRSVRESR